MGFELSDVELQSVVSWTKLKDGSQRAFYSWPCSSPSVAAASLLIVPGLGEHGGRYQQCANFFAARELDVYAIDLIGHGLSPGERGCIESYEGILDEIEAAVEAVVSRNPNLPLVLWGHSMGGNLVLNYLLRKSRLPHCAIASGPMLRAGNPPGPSFMWFARKLAMVWPNYRLQTPVHYSDCTRDPVQIQRMSSDRLFHKRVSLRLGAALIDSGEWAIEHAGELRTPLLLIHSEQDAITSAAASKEFAANCNDLCELRILPDSLHDLHRDVDSEAILQSMQEWMVKRAK